MDFGFDKIKIRDFWQEWDIYFSCSDWEGHSISQCEGIASDAGMDRMRERNKLYKIMFWRNYVISFNYNAITKCS